MPVKGLVIGDAPHVEQHYVEPARTIQGGWEDLVAQVTARLERKLELSLPLIPLLLDYKVELGVDSEVDLRAVWVELCRRVRSLGRS